MTVSVICALLIGLFTARSIVKPVLQLVDGTQRVSQRDLSHRIELDR
jgi:two-component system nitrate/nitrite sensor histidine kinase NarX